jgi:hypothetical protein
MTGKADFTPDEWNLVLEGPPSAAMIVVMAQRGGTVRESISMAKVYTEVRRREGDTQLVDEIASAKPEIDHTRYRSFEELKEQGLKRLQEVVELLERKATPEEVDDYKRFVLALADGVANAHREGFLGLSGERISEAERAAVDAIGATLGSSAA